MRLAPRWAMLGVFVVSALAGCFGSADIESKSEPSADALPAEFDETTGALAGIVTTPELSPVPGAQIALLDTEFSTQTDAAGQFTLSRVPPGEYRLAAQALGYQSKAQKVTVEMGKATELKLVLTPMPSDAPFHVVDIRKASIRAVMYKATPQCIYEPLTSVNPLLKTCGGLRLDCNPSDSCEVHYREQTAANMSWKTITGEMTWQAQSGFTGKAFLFDLNAPNITRGSNGAINQASPYTWVKMAGQAPIVVRVDKPTTLEERKIPPSDWDSYPEESCTAPTAGAQHCDWFFRVFAGYCDLGSNIGNCETTPDYGVMVDSVFTVYLAIFYKEPAPEGYSSLPDE